MTSALPTFGPSDPGTLGVRAQALATVVSDRHVVCDRTAAWLHGIDAHAYGEHELVPAVELCAVRGHQPTHVSGTDSCVRDLLPRDIMVIRGVRVTTPLRTALDLGCCLKPREAFAVLVAFARLHGLTVADYTREVRRYRRRRGVVQLRDLIPLVDPRMESPRECWTFLEIRNEGLPLPEPQVWIAIDGVPTYRLDFAYRKRRVCIEYDGVDAHERTPEQRQRDRVRRRWLRDHGWTVIVVRLGDFTGAGRDRWINELRAALKPTYTTRRW